MNYPTVATLCATVIGLAFMSLQTAATEAFVTDVTTVADVVDCGAASFATDIGLALEQVGMDDATLSRSQSCAAAAATSCGLDATAYDACILGAE